MGNKVRKFHEKMLSGKKLSNREKNLMDLLLRRNDGMRRVYICAPYDGYDTRSREEIWWYCMFAKDRGCIPIAPDYYYPAFWNTEDSREMSRLRSIAIGELNHCDEVWAFGKRITPDMEILLHSAAKRGLMIHFLPDWGTMKDLLPEGDDEDE